MLTISKPEKILYYAVTIPTIILVSVFCIFNDINLSLILLILTLVLFALLKILSKSATKKSMIALKKLTDDAETEDYIKFFEYASGCRNHKLSNIMKSVLLNGYVAEGSFEKATALFYEIKKSINALNKPEENYNQLVFGTNYLLHTGQLNEAFEFLKLTEDCIRRLPPKYDNREEVYHNLRIKYLCVSNQLTSADEFNYYFEKASTRIAKLQLKFFYAAFLEAKDARAATEEYKYVADNGKNLHIAKIARQRINVLEKTQKN